MDHQAPTTADDLAAERRANVRAYLMLAVATFFWAVGVVIGRGVHETIPPVGIAFWRWLVAAVILLPFVWNDLRRHWPLLVQKLWVIALLGALQGGSGALLFLSLNYTGAINAALVNGAQPVLTVLAAWILLRETVTFRHMIGVTIAMIGVGTMIARGSFANLMALDFNGGDLLVVVAIMGYACYAIGLRLIPRGMNVWTPMFGIAIFAAISMLPVYLYESIQIRTMPATLEAAAVILTLALLVSIVSIYLWNSGNRVIGHNRAAIFVNLFPIYGAILAILFLGETLYWFHIVGAAFVAVGIFLVIRKAG